jgi:hypothetical protein
MNANYYIGLDIHKKTILSPYSAIEESHTIDQKLDTPSKAQH